MIDEWFHYETVKEEKNIEKSLDKFSSWDANKYEIRLPRKVVRNSN